MKIIALLAAGCAIVLSCSNPGDIAGNTSGGEARTVIAARYPV